MIWVVMIVMVYGYRKVETIRLWHYELHAT